MSRRANQSRRQLRRERREMRSIIVGEAGSCTQSDCSRNAHSQVTVYRLRGATWRIVVSAAAVGEQVEGENGIVMTPCTIKVEPRS